MATKFQTGVMWFRRDLRTEDNAALSAALEQCEEVHCVFVFDRDILENLPRVDRRVEFIRESLVELDNALRTLAGKPDAGLIVRHAHAVHEIPALALELGAKAIFAGRDYEPQAKLRDDAVRGALALQGATLVEVKDHVVFERREILTQMGKPYGVFTPYKNNWLSQLAQSPPVIPFPYQ
jgi:deoxyribodipyrimidine photo-lyase